MKYLSAKCITLFLSLFALPAIAQPQCGQVTTDLARLSKPKLISKIKAKYDDFPSTATIIRAGSGQDYTHMCGGVIIGDSWILTAAHCVINCEEDEIKIMMSGDQYPHEDELVGDAATLLAGPIGVKMIKMLDDIPGRLIDPADHGFRGSPIISGDIALLKLIETIDFDDGAKIAKVATPADLEELRNTPDTNLHIAAFGVDKFGGEPTLSMREGEFPLVDTDNCNNYHNKMINSATMLCAGSSSLKDLSCSGDSGSGLFWRKSGDGEETLLIGLVSWSLQCASGIGQGVYTNLPQFKDWITESIN